jgi:hypothetical protein
MISVVININDKTIMARSASRIEGEEGEICTYKVDDGRIIKHDYNDGCVKLAIKLLEGIKE